jgi:hypothetical protein
MSDYLYVKNWGELQHYKKRNPPWIKLYRRLMTDGKFHMLTEQEQWQLVRIWLVSAEEHPGGYVPNDEQWLRRMTSSMRPIPLAKLTDQGWLIPVPASTYASAALAPLLASEEHFPPEVELQRFRRTFLPSNVNYRRGTEGRRCKRELPDLERVLKEMPA